MQTGPQHHQPVRLIRPDQQGPVDPSHDFRRYLVLVRGLRAAATLAAVPLALHAPDYAGVCGPDVGYPVRFMSNEPLSYFRLISVYRDGCVPGGVEVKLVAEACGARVIVIKTDGGCLGRKKWHPCGGVFYVCWKFVLPATAVKSVSFASDF